MPVMVLVPASKESEAGVLPDTKILAEMGRFDDCANRQAGSEN